MTPLDDRYISNKNICEVNETNVVSRQVIQTPLMWKQGKSKPGKNNPG